MDFKPLITAILSDYQLPLSGDHGVVHWARVHENGLRVAEHSGANILVVRLFAIFHDSRRENEYSDPDHGCRGAEFAKQLRGDLFDLSDHEFSLLYKACQGHTHEKTHPDITIQTCWDSDRLDLGRVGITPHPSRLCTEYAKLPKTIQWANRRAEEDFVPDSVLLEWGIVPSDFRS